MWIINAYPLVMAGLLLGAGTLGDRVGHRRMFQIGLVLFAAASLVAAFSPSPAVLIAARAGLAVGAAAMMPATLALIRVAFVDERERNLAIAVWGSVSVLGMALGPIISGALLATFWWGSVFLINVPVALAALLVLPLVAPRNDPDPSRAWDLPSSVLATAALSGLVLFIKEAAKPDRQFEVVIGSALLAVISGAFFARRQRRLVHPLLDVTVFRNAAFSSGVVAAALAMFAVAGLQLLMTQRFQLVAGFSPLQSGLLVAAIALGSLPTSLLAGAFLHVAGLRLLVSGGLALVALGSVLVATTVGTGLAPVVLGLVVVGTGIGAVMAVASTAIVGNVPARRAGMASSVEEVSYEFGSLIAVALLGTLLTSFYASSISLPAGAPAEAANSLSQALAVADGDGALVAAAFSAFDAACAILAWIIAGLMVVGSLVTAIVLRQHGLRTASTQPDSVH